MTSSSQYHGIPNRHENHENPQIPSSTAFSSYDVVTHRYLSSPPKHSYDIIKDTFPSTVRDAIYKNQYRIALLINDCTSCHDLAITAIGNPISTCTAVALVVLNPSTSNKSVTEFSSDDKDVEAEAWLRQYNIQVYSETSTTNHTIKFQILYGDSGFQSVLNDASIHAMYIFVPSQLQQQYVIATLNASKHVLLKDIVSTPIKDYSSQLQVAKLNQKFIQFSTMFVHHYHVQTFLNCVCATKTFGTIVEIDTILTINIADLKLLNVSLPLSSGQGCIRRLARFSVLIATLMLRDNNNSKNTTTTYQPVSARVTESIVDDVSGEPISANCEILFTNDVLLKCYVVYSDASTRQVLTVKSNTDRYATITDFVLPHPDGLTTYRVYDKVYNKYTKKYDIVRGECLDVPTGPPQNVAMWRNFHSLCRTVDVYGWDNSNKKDTSTEPSSRISYETDVISIKNNEELLGEALSLTESAVQTKRILIALDESFYNGGKAIYFNEK